MPSPILARADALMQRRQHQAAPDDVPTLTEAIGDDGIPLLLNVETAPPLLEEPASAIPEALPSKRATAAQVDSNERDRLIHELARRVEQRLISVLPQIIAATVDDFLAEQDISENASPRP